MKYAKNIISSVFIFFAITTLAVAAYPDVKVILNAAKSVGSGKAWQFDKGVSPRVAQVVMGGASSSEATVTLDGSLDGTNWNVLSTFNMASSPAASMVATANIDYPWSALRGTIVAISSVSGAVAANVSTITMMVAE